MVTDESACMPNSIEQPLIKVGEGPEDGGPELTMPVEAEFSIRINGRVHVVMVGSWSLEWSMHLPRWLLCLYGRQWWQ